MEKFVTRAARLNKAYDIELIERELECGEDDIIVRNHMMGICGSDKSFYRGSMPPQTAEFRQPPEFPFLLGHESGGTVVAVGDRVSDYKVGDKVMAFGWNNNFADYFKSKAFQLQPVPDGLDMDIAALGEPTACAMYSGLNTGVQLGDTVVIMGGGYAGQIIAQVVKKMGAAKVICVDVVDGKLNLAKKMGADIVLNPNKDDVVGTVLKETNNQGADVVIEVAGNDSAIQLCSDVLKHGGIMGLYSWVLEPAQLYINRWHNDGFDIRTLALMHRIKIDRPWWIEKTMQNVANGMIQIDSLISHVFDLADAAKAFDVACNDPDACKVMLRP